jgi:hypothetical protein
MAAKNLTVIVGACLTLAVTAPVMVADPPTMLPLPEARLFPNIVPDPVVPIGNNGRAVDFHQSLEWFTAPLRSMLHLQHQTPKEFAEAQEKREQENRMAATVVGALNLGNFLTSTHKLLSLHEVLDGVLEALELANWSDEMRHAFSGHQENSPSLPRGVFFNTRAPSYSFLSPTPSVWDRFSVGSISPQKYRLVEPDISRLPLGQTSSSTPRFYVPKLSGSMDAGTTTPQYSLLSPRASVWEKQSLLPKLERVPKYRLMDTDLARPVLVPSLAPKSK